MRLRPQDRRAFFESLDTERGEATPVLIVHVARASDSADDDGLEPEASLDALRAVPLPKAPAIPWPELAEAMDRAASIALPFVCRLAERTPQIDAAKFNGDHPEAIVAEIRARIEAGDARSPTCLAPFSLLYLQSDGEMRPCCVLRTQVGSLRNTSFEDAWNDPAFLTFRQSIQGQRQAHSACNGCRDPNRWGALVEALEVLVADGLDVKRISRPPDFDPPASIADNQLVKLWGQNVA